jgi:hypothetical protein
MYFSRKHMCFSKLQRYVFCNRKGIEVKIYKNKESCLRDRQDSFYACMMYKRQYYIKSFMVEKLFNYFSKYY